MHYASDDIEIYFFFLKKKKMWGDVEVGQCPFNDNHLNKSGPEQGFLFSLLWRICKYRGQSRKLVLFLQDVNNLKQSK